MNDPITKNRLHYEDLAEGGVIVLGSTTLSRDDIVGFAREFDPFPFHLDEEAARRSLLGGLASSGWQTAAVSMRLLVDGFLNTLAVEGSLGLSDLKWRRPVLVGDTLSAVARIAGLRRTPPRLDQGIVTLDLSVTNQRGETVMTVALSYLVALRDPGTPMPETGSETAPGDRP